MFKVGSKVVYPRYGVGLVTEISKIYLDHDATEYFEIDFLNSQISVSVPVDKAEELGLRKPCTKKELEEDLKDLGKKIKVDQNQISNLDVVTREKLKSGNVSDAVEIVNMINAHSKQKEKDNKKISFTESKYLESAKSFLSSLVQHTLGKKALDKYDLESYEINNF